MSNQQQVLQHLDELGISYTNHEHEAVFTCEDAAKIDRELPGVANKNLFLRNKKGDQHYLISIPADKRLDLKALRTQLGTTKLSFGSPERLMEWLQLTPGSVSPYGLINDTQNHVLYYLDKDILAQEQVVFHPNINTATVEVSRNDFQKYLDAVGNTWQVIEL